jgi:hypothetical protein
VRSDRFLIRQLVQLGFTANALRPVPGGPASVPAFFSGWLTAELAPHLLALSALDSGVHTVRHGIHTRRDVTGLLAAAGNIAGYTTLIAGGRRASHEIEDALVETLGSGYRDAIRRDPLPDDVSAPLSSLALPFRRTSRRTRRCCSRSTAARGRSATRTSRASRSCCTWRPAAGSAWR